jgi:tryptophanyl-tRNA synthetase
MSKGRILSGMRPTGKLHLGHMSVLENWVRLQDEYECNFMVADWHALTSDYADTSTMQEKIKDMVIDWISVGIDPEKSVIFKQSDVKEHAELHLLFSMVTPLSWLERVPTYKDQITNLGAVGKDLNTYGFLGYPLLQAADILVYKGNAVPVGEDQVPHLELTREIARRFNHLFKREIFPEPKAILNEVSLLPGTDGRKMSKSYNNFINISGPEDELAGRIREMITDPSRLRKTDPGNPDVCTVYTYHKLYNPGEVPELTNSCKQGEIGCVACKKRLTEVSNSVISPFRERRAELLDNPKYIDEVLAHGAERARIIAQKTMEEVRNVVNI